jgi:hypothetical protein
MSTGTLRNDEVVAFSTIEGISLGLFTEVNFPEPETDHQTRHKPLSQGSFSAGGKVTYGEITASREIEWPSDEALVASLLPYQGGAGSGECAFHAAPGHKVNTSPLAGHTYNVVLLTIATKGGVNAAGDAITMIEAVFGVNGVGK